ncbi:MAG: N-acetylgalactosamine 6-sulfate sulfatase (GALNS), partial [Verrucomicrobiota bacterium]
VADNHPEIVQQLRDIYPSWWESVSPAMTPVAIDIGNPAENPTTLCSQDWYLESGNPPWNFGSIKKRPRVTGPWIINVKQPGRYRFTLREMPKEADIPIQAVRAKIEISGKTAESEIESGVTGVNFELDLPAGRTELWTWLFDADERAGGAYFTDVELLD